MMHALEELTFHLDEDGALLYTLAEINTGEAIHSQRCYHFEARELKITDLGTGKIVEFDDPIWRLEWSEGRDGIWAREAIGAPYVRHVTVPTVARRPKPIDGYSQHEVDAAQELLPVAEGPR